MSEKVIRAKRWDQLWFVSATRRRWDIIPIIAWAVPDSGAAIPITPFGRFDTTKPYVVGTGVNFIAFPEGCVLSDNNEVSYYLEHGHAR